MFQNRLTFCFVSINVFFCYSLILPLITVITNRTSIDEIPILTFCYISIYYMHTQTINDNAALASKYFSLDIFHNNSSSKAYHKLLRLIAKILKKIK
jgi:hypothetical protein